MTEWVTSEPALCAAFFVVGVLWGLWAASMVYGRKIESLEADLVELAIKEARLRERSLR